MGTLYLLIPVIVALADAIAPLIRPQYYVEVETRTHKDVLPIEVKERYLEIRAVRDDRVITVIELLSPANKRPGKGSRALMKRSD